MINRKRALSVLSLFAVSFIMIFAFATDAATTTPADNSKKLVKENYNVSASSAYNDTSSEYNDTNFTWLNNESTGQVRIRGDSAIGDGNKNTSVEVNFGDGWETWNSSEYISKQRETYGSLSVLRGSVPMATKKIDVQPILDRIGYQEAQFPDVQKVTLYGLDDARVIEYYGYGDCWADACWLYDKLSAEGIPVRIMGYENGVRDGHGRKSRHTWVEINVGNGWEMWNYKKYNSQHVGDVGFGPTKVLIEPGHAPADILSLGY